MAQTTLVSSISRVGTFPILEEVAASNSCGMLALTLNGTWTEQMIHELPTLNIQIYLEDGSLYSTFEINMTTVYEELKDLQPTAAYSIPIYNIPPVCEFHITPLFDKYALDSYNAEVESGNIEFFNTSNKGIVDTDTNNYSNELWTVPTSIFNVTITFDDSNISAGGGGGGSQPAIVIDTQVMQGSTNPVENGAIYDFVNSSVSTNTANFIGTFNSVADLEAYSGTVTNNDYAFVIGTDSAGNTVYNRYKYNGSAWGFEYALNNSSFTAAQWATIQSGLTASDKTKLDGIETGANKTVVDTVFSASSANPVANSTLTATITPMTQAEYDALVTKDKPIYFVYET